MKKIALAILVVFGSMQGYSQKKEVSNAQKLISSGELDKAWESINAALTNPETKDQPKTWFVKGSVLQAIGDSKDAKYATISQNPYMDAIESYKKAIELDPKQRINKDIDLKLLPLSTTLQNQAVEAFTNKDFNKSTEYFVVAAEISKMPMFQNVVDTAILFNAGLAAVNAENWPIAIKYLEQAKVYNYAGASTITMLKNAYLAQKDSANAEKTLQEGFQANPNDVTITAELINYYLLSGKGEKALDYLNVAKKNDPSNPSYYFAEGTVYEKMKEFDKAEGCYLKSIEVDPTYFNGYYNIGVLHYNKAVQVFEEATKTRDDKEYARLVEVGNGELKKSLPWMEKAHGVDPTEATTKETLKTLYYRMQSIDSENQASWKAKYDEMMQKISSGK